MAYITKRELIEKVEPVVDEISNLRYEVIDLLEDMGHKLEELESIIEEAEED